MTNFLRGSKLSKEKEIGQLVGVALNRAIKLKTSAVGSLLDKRDFIDWQQVDKELKEQEGAIAALQTKAETGAIDEVALVDLLTESPEVYPLLLSLLAFHASGTQIEKWGLPDHVPRSKRERDRLAGNLAHLGISNLFDSSPSVRPLARVALVHKDSFRRRFRTGNKFEKEVVELVKRSAAEASEGLANALVVARAAVLGDARLARFLDNTILYNDKPIAAVATVFQQQSGGRQQRELSVTYPNLQKDLSSLGVSLILIADGPGIQDTSERALQLLIDGVRFPMTVSQAESGMLVEAMQEASRNPERAVPESATLDRLIVSSLDHRSKVAPEDLPVQKEEAVLALARFKEMHPELAVEFLGENSNIQWSNPDLVQKADKLSSVFSPELALDVFGELMGARPDGAKEIDAEGIAVLELNAPLPFHNRLAVNVVHKEFDEALVKRTAVAALERTPSSKVTILIVPTAFSMSNAAEHRRSQLSRPVSVIVLTPELLQRASRSADPIRIVIEEVLRQADLRKVSPFVLANATPPQMFFGRDQEAAATLSTIASSSVAILGSRRIGKTSLLRRLMGDLKEAGLSPYFADCQTVRSWSDFAKVAAGTWNVEVPEDFSPRSLPIMIERLSEKSEGHAVLLLDEIDQLLLWDQEHDEDTVPEAFFRACRALSQAGSAQFIFSGERAIARKIWDPHSPHWNFCRDIQITQLSKADAIDLLLSPIRELGIAVTDVSIFSDLAWKFTSGHPQIVQYLGDRLIRTLNQSEGEVELRVTPQQLTDIVESFEYAEHYVTTYLGQATPLEKSISYLVGQGTTSIAGVRARLGQSEEALDEIEFATALRIIQLYGIVEVEGNDLKLRAEWFPDAMKFFGQGSE